MNESNLEFVIWGIPKGETHEQLLYTRSQSHTDAKRVLKILTDKHGIKDAHIQILDLDENPAKTWENGSIFK